MNEAGTAFDEALARFEERFFNRDKTPPDPLGALSDDLFRIVIRYGSVEGIVKKVEEEWVIVFTLPEGEERIAKRYFWFRILLARLAYFAAEMRHEDQMHYVPEAPQFTAEEIAAEFQRLQLTPEMPDDTVYDIKVRRSRVLRSLQESSTGVERAKRHKEEFWERQVNPYGFAVTVDYPLDGEPVPLYIETMNDPTFPVYFRLRRLDSGEPRPPDHPQLVVEMYDERQRQKEQNTQ